MDLPPIVCSIDTLAVPSSPPSVRFQQQQQQQPPPPPPLPHHYPSAIAQSTDYTASSALSPYSSTIRDAILNPTCSANDLATAMQLCPNIAEIITAVFAAVVLVTSSPEPELGDPIRHIMHCYSSAINLWPRTMNFKAFNGPLSGRHLLHYAIRKNATWIPLAPFPHHPHDMQEELTRITLDRQRKRDHVLWARIHAASLELGLVENTWLAETLANDAMWEADEVEWVSGCVLLKGLVRAGKVPTDAGTGNWADLMHRYQSKWKEVRDEGRQALMAVSCSHSAINGLVCVHE